MSPTEEELVGEEEQERGRENGTEDRQAALFSQLRLSGRVAALPADSSSPSSRTGA